MKWYTFGKIFLFQYIILGRTNPLPLTYIALFKFLANVCWKAATIYNFSTFVHQWGPRAVLIRTISLDISTWSLVCIGH